MDPPYARKPSRIWASPSAERSAEKELSIYLAQGWTAQMTATCLNLAGMLERLKRQRSVEIGKAGKKTTTNLYVECGAKRPHLRMNQSDGSNRPRVFPSLHTGYYFEVKIFPSLSDEILHCYPLSPMSMYTMNLLVMIYGGRSAAADGQSRLQNWKNRTTVDFLITTTTLRLTTTMPR